MAKGLNFHRKRLPMAALLLVGAFVAGSASYLAVHDAVTPAQEDGEEEYRLTVPTPSGSSVTVPDTPAPPDQPAEPDLPADPPEEEPPPEMVAVDPAGEPVPPEEDALLSVSADTQVAMLYVRPVDGTVSKPWSAGELVYSETLGDYRTHDGVDIQAAAGSEVRAMADGTVADIYEDDLLGQVVEIRHADGTVTRYANLETGAGSIRVGAAVSMGEVIGAVGQTALGESGEAPHLHLEALRDGVRLDPETLW